LKRPRHATNAQTLEQELQASVDLAEASQISADADSRAGVTVDAMDRLNSSSRRIGSVLDTISDIADQTNLLALNATIEAASAGEAGKGFAVVANEVKEFAKQTAVATEEIGRQIEDMRDHTTNAMDAIQEVSTVISRVNDINRTIASAVEEQSATTNEIARSIGGASDAAGEVNRSVQTASSGASDVNSFLNEVGQGVQENAASAEQTSSASDELARMATSLAESMGRFKT